MVTKKETHTHFWGFLNSKIVATALKASMTALLWYSKNTVQITFAHNEKQMTCRKALPLPFYNINVGVTTRFLKLFDLFLYLWNHLSVGLHLPHHLPSEFNVCVLGYSKKLVYACFYIFF